MKKLTWIAITIVALGALVGCATTPPAVGKPMVVQRVIEVEGTQENLYRMANEWMAKTFVASSAVIQYQDKDEGIIVGRSVTAEKLGYGVRFDIWYNMTLEAKENKVRITIKDIYGELPMDRDMKIKPEEMVQKDYDELEAKFNALIDDFSAYMKQETEEW